MRILFTWIIISIATSASSQICIPNTNSFQFDGFSTDIAMPSSSALDITDVITIEAWINSDSWGFTSAQNTIVCKHGWSAGEGGYVFRAGGNGELSFNIGADSAGIPKSWHEVISSPAALQLNTWYHVAASFDGTSLSIYINGVLAGTNTLPFSGSITPSTSYDLRIGRLADIIQPETRYFSGMMDEIRVWHRVLTPGEIIANMNTHIDPLTQTGLVGYWRMNDGSGTTVADLGSGGNTGTITGGTWSTDVPFSDTPPVPVITQNGLYLVSSAVTGNQWSLNGVPIPGATGTFYTPLQIGTYTVTVSDTGVCTATSAPFVITTIGIETISTLCPVKVQNLSDGALRFIASNEILAKAELQLFDIHGRQIALLEKGNVKSEMDVSMFSEGIYLLYLQVEDNVYKLKIVLN